MAEYLVTVGSFSAVTSGTQAAITGLGFQPKAIMFFWTNQNTTDSETLVGSESHYGMAFTDVTTNYGQCINEYEWVNATRAGRAVWTAYTIERWTRSSGGYAIDARATMDTFDSDGFTLSWSDYPSSAFRISYIAFGGADLEAYVGTYTLPNTTGDKAVTGVGFQPRSVFVAAASGDGGTTGSSTAFYADMFGVACDDGTKTVTCVGDPIASNVMNRNDATIWGTTGGAGATMEGTVSAYGSDGFTINMSNAPAADQLIGFLATNLICTTGGDNWDGNADTAYQVTGIGDVSIGLLTHIAVSGAVSTVNNGTTGAVRQLGAWDGTTSRDVAAGGSGTNPVVANEIQTDKLASLIDPGSGIYTQITPVSMDSDGFTVDFDATAAAGRAWCWVALGVGQGPTTFVPQIYRRF